jgi:hypothetical protein
MKKILVGGFRAAFVALLTTVAASAALAQQAAPTEDQPPAGTESWEYRAAGERTPPVRLSVQKAQARGAQRMARLEAMRWYGFSNSRPTAAAIPWTTMYSPAWQTPGGRPFAWYTSSRPIIVINSPYPTPVYR